jgi:hypothetical protein
MPPAFVPCGQHGRKRVLEAKCGKGSLLRRVEPCERAIGRMHGRCLLCVGRRNERMVDESIALEILTRASSIELGRADLRGFLNLGGLLL